MNKKFIFYDKTINFLFYDIQYAGLNDGLLMTLNNDNKDNHND